MWTDVMLSNSIKKEAELIDWIYIICGQTSRIIAMNFNFNSFDHCAESV